MLNYQEFTEVFEKFSGYADLNGKSVIESQWVTGGISGGNCWDSGGHYPLDTEQEPKSWGLDEILVEHFGNMTFVDYRKLVEECVDQSTDSCNEYYGNYTTYAIKKVELDKLYFFLKEHGYVN